MRDKVNGRNERSCLGGGGRRRRGDDGRDFHFDAPKRARWIVCIARWTKEIAIMHSSRIPCLFLSSLYLSQRMINSRAIVPYLEPQLFPRTLQRYRVEALFASIGQKRLIILSTTEFHGSRTMLLSSFPRSPFLNLCLLETRTTWTELEPRRYLFVFDFFRIARFE